MTIHETMAGREAVRFFLNGFPRLRTSADFRAGFREAAEVQIEHLIGALDALDGDPDLEDAGDSEPSLGWVDGAFAFRYGGTDDREIDADVDEGDAREDKEPSLGWANELTRCDHEDGTEPLSPIFATMDLEYDVADARHDGDGEDREPSEDCEISDPEADA